MVSLSWVWLRKCGNYWSLSGLGYTGWSHTSLTPRISSEPLRDREQLVYWHISYVTFAFHVAHVNLRMQLISLPELHLTFQSLLVTWCTSSLTFNICTLCPHCIYVFCIYLRTNSDLCHLQYKQIGFYNRDEKCLLRGTDWVFKYNSLGFVYKRLSNVFLNVGHLAVLFQYGCPFLFFFLAWPQKDHGCITIVTWFTWKFYENSWYNLHI